MYSDIVWINLMYQNIFRNSVCENRRKWFVESKQLVGNKEVDKTNRTPPVPTGDIDSSDLLVCQPEMKYTKKTIWFGV